MGRKGDRTPGTGSWRELSDMKGFSVRTLLFMRSFAEACPDAEKVKQLVSQLPWGHVIRLLQRVKEPEVRVT